MEELFLGLVFGLLFLAGLVLWHIAKLLWRFLVWVTKPIRDEIAYQKMVRRELEKESRLREIHRQAIEQIDRTVAYYVNDNEQAITRLDRQSGRRQSG
jgi:cell division protein FtsB